MNMVFISNKNSMMILPYYQYETYYQVVLLEEKVSYKVSPLNCFSAHSYRLDKTLVQTLEEL